MKAWVPAAVTAALLSVSAASASRLQSGLHGYVEKGPITPVCYADRPCSGPAAGVTLSFRRTADGPVTRTKTRANGFYRVALPAGVYLVTTDARFDRTPAPRKARVRAGRDDRLDFFLDTGIQ
jgi:hypothetical protein